jgi:hypothetical protein
MLPVVAFSVKVLPAVLPELDALRAISPALLSSIYTAPLDDAASVVAFTEAGAVKFMPAEPALSVMLAEFRLPVAVMPLLAFEALSMNVEPELAPS